MGHRPRLSPVPSQPRRVLGVIRVSKERTGMVSPEIQETAIRDYCTARGYVLADVVEGLDESGSQRRSSWWRRLDDAVAAVEDGTYDGIVVWKFSRAARHRLRWAVALDRVDVAGGVLESATEQFDTTTSAGRFARGMVAEMNAFEAERIGEVWKEAHQRRVSAGLPATGKPKWGYAYDRETKMHVPDPETGPVLASMYRRYVAGESVYALSRWLNAHGYRTLAGGPWSDRTLRRVLDSGFAAGFFLVRGVMHEGRHEPLIDRDLWRAYQDSRAARRVVHPRVERSSYLLAGLIRCARCGGAMVANYVDPGTRLSRRARGAAEGKRYSNGRPRMTYRCDRGKATGRCRGGSIQMRVVEEFVLAHVADLAAAVDEDAGTQLVIDTRRTLLEVEEQRLARETAKVEQALIQLAVRDAESPMPRSVYEASREQLEQRGRELAAAAEAIARNRRRSPVDPREEAVRLLEQWDELPVSVRREVLRGLIDCVLVRTGEGWMRVVAWDEVRG